MILDESLFEADIIQPKKHYNKPPKPRLSYNIIYDNLEDLGYNVRASNNASLDSAIMVSKRHEKNLQKAKDYCKEIGLECEQRYSKTQDRYYLDIILPKNLSEKLEPIAEEFEEYKGYNIEYNFYNQNEYTVQYQGDDVWFDNKEAAKKFIDEITSGKNIEESKKSEIKSEIKSAQSEIDYIKTATEAAKSHLESIKKDKDLYLPDPKDKRYDELLDKYEQLVKSFEETVAIGEKILSELERKNLIKEDLQYDKNGLSIKGNTVIKASEDFEEITIPSTVKEIEKYAFFRNSSLKSVSMSDSVVDIGESAFADCFSLQNVKLSNNIDRISTAMFHNCISLTNITIPNTVKMIGNEAFMGCHSLEHIIIPSSVDSIGTWAFQGCSKLNNIVIPNGVDYIGDYTFYDCESLTNIEIPNSVIKIEKNALEFTSKDLTIKCHKGSYAEQYAKENNIKVEYINTNETLKEDLSPEQEQEYGLTTMINNLIKDELEAIDGYNSAIVTLEAENKGEFTDVIRDIISEENTHIGQLQAILKELNPSTTADIDDGQKEGQEQIDQAVGVTEGDTETTTTIDTEEGVIKTYKLDKVEDMKGE